MLFIYQGLSPWNKTTWWTSVASAPPIVRIFQMNFRLYRCINLHTHYHKNKLILMTSIIRVGQNTNSTPCRQGVVLTYKSSLRQKIKHITPLITRCSTAASTSNTHRNSNQHSDHQGHTILQSTFFTSATPVLVALSGSWNTNIFIFKIKSCVQVLFPW
jgi:hypothetical protein